MRFDDDLVRFGRAGHPGREKPVALWQDTWWDLSGSISDLGPDTISTAVFEELEELVRNSRVPELVDGPDRLGPPLSRPNSLVCIGQNYAAHARESGAEPPEMPIVFFKHPGALTGAFDYVPIPPGATSVDWEVELAVIIGRNCYQAASLEEAKAAIVAYSISDDVSERDYQISRSGGQWSKGKSFPRFNPFGPFLVPASAFPDGQVWRLGSFVNGEKRQDSTTADMIFSVQEIVHDLSQVMQLQPGDIINTGTPEGVAFSGRFPYLVPGDVVRIEIDGLGHQEHVFTGEH